jgi:hypothetical protein
MLDTSLQLRLISCLVLSTKPLTEFYDDIKPEYWSNPQHKYLVNLILGMYPKLRRPPSKDNLLDEIQSRKLRDAGSYRDMLDSIYSLTEDEVDNLYMDKLGILIKESAYTVTTSDSIELIKQKRFDEINAKWMKVMGIGTGSKGIDCFDDDSLQSGLDPDRKLYDRRGHVPTLFPTLDKYLKGGPAARELHAIVAPPNIGKSRFLRNIGYNACVQGKKVLHITAEMDEGICREQLYQLMGGLTIEQVHTEDGRLRIRQKSKGIESRGGRYHIKSYDPYTATMAQVESYMIRSGEKWDIITTDYLDLFLMSGKSLGNVWLDQLQLFAEGRRLARRMDCVHWTVIQPVDVDENEIITLRKAGGSKGKGATLDSMMSLNASIEQERAGEFNGFMAKNRFGVARRPIKFMTRPEVMLVREYPTDAEVAQKIQESVEKAEEEK